jgi:hypothetical protein
MSFAITHPAALAAAVTTVLPPAAADEVSALTATQFSAHAVQYQTVSTQATAVHEMFTSVFGASATTYAATEAANAITTN